MLTATERPTVVSPAPREAWAAAVDEDPTALASQAPAWVDAACADSRYRDASRLYEFGDGRRMVLPLLRRRGTSSSMPDGLGIGGLVGSPRTPGAIAEVLDDLRNVSGLAVRIRPNPVEADLWRAARSDSDITVGRRAHVLDLRPGRDEVWGGLRKTRRSVGKAQRSDLEIVCDTDGRHVDEYLHLFNLSIERWAAQQNEPISIARWRNRHQPSVEDLRRRAAALDGGFRLWLARKDGAPAAAIIVLVGRVAHHTKGAMDRDLAGPTRANHLLQWLAIEDAIAAGCPTYHMGDSGTSDSLGDFKESFGAVPFDYEELRVERLPVTAADRMVRSAVKRVIGFKEA